MLEKWWHKNDKASETSWLLADDADSIGWTWLTHRCKSHWLSASPMKFLKLMLKLMPEVELHELPSCHQLHTNFSITLELLWSYKSFSKRLFKLSRQCKTGCISQLKLAKVAELHQFPGRFTNFIELLQVLDSPEQSMLDTLRYCCSVFKLLTLQTWSSHPLHHPALHQPTSLQLHLSLTTSPALYILPWPPDWSLWSITCQLTYCTWSTLRFMNFSNFSNLNDGVQLHCHNTNFCCYIATFL